MQGKASKRSEPQFRVGDSVAVLFGPQYVAGEILEDRGPLGNYDRRLYRVRINAGQEDELSLDVLEEEIVSRDQNAAFVQTPGLRQEFEVTYDRQRKSNQWSATTKRGTLYRGIKAKVPSRYSTGRWEEGTHERRGPRHRPPSSWKSRPHHVAISRGPHPTGGLADP